MKTILAALLLLFAFGAQAATVTNGLVSCTDSITATPTAPQYVPIDCTATTGVVTAATNPFSRLEFRVNFGDTALASDPNGATWANAANTALSKNQAYGAVSGHVYQTAGTFTWTVTVSNGTEVRSVSNSNTIAAANDTFDGAATTCYFNTTVGTGCPPDSTEAAATDDFDAAIVSASCNASGKRCLFQRGSTFTASADGDVSTAGVRLIGAYGPATDPLPIINLDAGIHGLNINGAAVADVRIMDLNFVGDATGLGNAINFSASVSGVTILRVTSNDTGGAGIVLSGAHTLTGGAIQESTLYNHNNGTILFGRFANSVILGNLVGPGNDGAAEHISRFHRLKKVAVSFNTFQDPTATRSVTTIRCDDFAVDGAAADCNYFIYSDNKLLQGTRATSIFKIEPNGVGIDARAYDYLVERNWVKTEAYTGGTSVVALSIMGQRGAVRNNLLDLDGPTVAGRQGVNLSQASLSVPEDIGIYNNTVYSNKAVSTIGVNVTTGSVNTIVQDNLCWFDVATPTTTCLQNTGTNTTNNTNSTDAETQANAGSANDPAFDGPLTSIFGFRIGTGSYAATGGTGGFPAANSDFFLCDDTTYATNKRRGATVPRVRARCRGPARQ